MFAFKNGCSIFAKRIATVVFYVLAFREYFMHTLIDRPFSSMTPAHEKHVTTSGTCRLRYFLDEEEDVEIRCRRFFGRTLQPREFAAICGGHAREIKPFVGIDGTALYLEYHHTSLDCVGACLIYQASDARLVLSNESIRFLNRTGIERKKRQWFSRQKVACQSLGISTIHINAARTSISQGYFYYPFFGFSAALPEYVCDSLPKNLAACRTLAELYEHPKGQKFWRQFGNACQMSLKIRETDVL